MTDDDDPVVRHFLVCRRVKYDPRIPWAPYSVRTVIFNRRPTRGYPVVLPAVWTFTHIEGTGSHEFWIEVVPYPDDEDDRPEAVASYGPYLVHLGPTPARLSRGWRLRGVPFPAPGMYSFDFTLGGVVRAQHFIWLEG